eukprot:TRINITY_DN25087_c0_g2_i1.p2 TRINITY_DN25087_c0_g2~~TRINITY_DN25087_c0_g2_i1.p2  ORF type:complete len:253 (+),score=62.84 TRINITY_DN25087_c0_g2_i1:104-862(+)
MAAAAVHRIPPLVMGDIAYSPCHKSGSLNTSPTGSICEQTIATEVCSLQLRNREALESLERFHEQQLMVILEQHQQMWESGFHFPLDPVAMPRPEPADTESRTPKSYSKVAQNEHSIRALDTDDHPQPAVSLQQAALERSWAPACPSELSSREDLGSGRSRPQVGCVSMEFAQWQQPCVPPSAAALRCAEWAAAVDSSAHDDPVSYVVEDSDETPEPPARPSPPTRQSSFQRLFSLFGGAVKAREEESRGVL